MHAKRRTHRRRSPARRARPRCRTGRGSSPRRRTCGATGQRSGLPGRLRRRSAESLTRRRVRRTPPAGASRVLVRHRSRSLRPPGRVAPDAMALDALVGLADEQPVLVWNLLQSGQSTSAELTARAALTRVRSGTDSNSSNSSSTFPPAFPNPTAASFMRPAQAPPGFGYSQHSERFQRARPSTARTSLAPTRRALTAVS
jgi:hypothetical protein